MKDSEWEVGLANNDKRMVSRQCQKNTKILPYRILQNW